MDRGEGGGGCNRMMRHSLLPWKKQGEQHRSGADFCTGKPQVNLFRLKLPALLGKLVQGYVITSCAELLVEGHSHRRPRRSLLLRRALHQDCRQHRGVSVLTLYPFISPSVTSFKGREDFTYDHQDGPGQSCAPPRNLQGPAEL